MKKVGITQGHPGHVDPQDRRPGTDSRLCDLATDTTDLARLLPAPARVALPGSSPLGGSRMAASGVEANSHGARSKVLQVDEKGPEAVRGPGAELGAADRCGGSDPSDRRVGVDHALVLAFVSERPRRKAARCRTSISSGPAD